MLLSLCILVGCPNFSSCSVCRSVEKVVLCCFRFFSLFFNVSSFATCFDAIVL